MRHFDGKLERVETVSVGRLRHSALDLTRRQRGTDGGQEWRYVLPTRTADGVNVGRLEHILIIPNIVSR